MPQSGKNPLTRLPQCGIFWASGMPQGGKPGGQQRPTGAVRHASRATGKEDRMTAKKNVKKVQTEIVENAHQIWLAGLGAVATAQEEGGKLFKNLVEKGQDFEKIGKNKVDQAKGAVSGVKVVAESYWETFERTLDDQVTAVIHRVGVPTKSEIEELTKKVEKLTGTIEKLAAKPAAKATPPARKAASTAKKAATDKAN
jgi:poly(hydroxyalkanoate) granule-associated protein